MRDLKEVLNRIGSSVFYKFSGIPVRYSINFIEKKRDSLDEAKISLEFEVDLFRIKCDSFHKIRVNIQETKSNTRDFQNRKFWSICVLVEEIEGFRVSIWGEFPIDHISIESTDEELERVSHLVFSVTTNAVLSLAFVSFCILRKNPKTTFEKSPFLSNNRSCSLFKKEGFNHEIALCWNYEYFSSRCGLSSFKLNLGNLLTIYDCCVFFFMDSSLFSVKNSRQKFSLLRFWSSNHHCHSNHVPNLPAYERKILYLDIPIQPCNFEQLLMKIINKDPELLRAWDTNLNYLIQRAV